MRARLRYPLARAEFVEQAKALLADHVAFEYRGAYPEQLADGLAEIAAERGVVTQSAIRELAGGHREQTQKTIDFVGARTTPTALAQLLAPSFLDRFFGSGGGFHDGPDGSLPAWGAQAGAGWAFG